MAAAITLALATAATMLLTRHRDLASGPLDLGIEHSESGGSYDIGDVVSFGAATVRNGSASPVRIAAVTLRPDRRDPGATVTEVYVLDLTGIREIAGIAAGFPPAGQAGHHFVPAAGATLAPGTTYQLMFVVRVERPGIWRFPSVDVRYHVDGLTYLATGWNGLRLCAPKGTDCAPIG